MDSPDRHQDDGPVAFLAMLVFVVVIYLGCNRIPDSKPSDPAPAVKEAQVK